MIIMIAAFYLKEIIVLFYVSTLGVIIRMFDPEIEIESIDIFDESWKSAISSIDLFTSNMTSLNYSIKRKSHNAIFESIALANYLFDRPEWLGMSFVKKKKNQYKSSKDSQHRLVDFNTKQNTKTFKFNIDPKILNLYPRENFSMTANFSVHLTAEYSKSVNFNDKNEKTLQNLEIFPNTRSMIRYIFALKHTSSPVKIDCKTNVLLKAINTSCVLYSFEDLCSSNIAHERYLVFIVIVKI
ncbi:hypothetical protein BpHYR1_028739 [Brachionus plicatilis]|uniref:Uncharacterized protein n=1 Tax=Brachionus plicatilis TaxID=10195 RepID=A0A3M7PVN1_BRAPC|nr:hypothetical protein BpHYR1_028739 [Brachionus plicatilis]